MNVRLRGGPWEIDVVFGDDYPYLPGVRSLLGAGWAKVTVTDDKGDEYHYTMTDEEPRP